MIVIFAAMKDELAALSPPLGSMARIAAAPLPAYQTTLAEAPVAFVLTGVGRQRAESTANWALAALTPERVLAVGISGALIPGLPAASVLACSDLVAVDDRLPPITADPAMLVAAQGALGRFSAGHRHGRCVTLPKVAETPQEKELLHRRYDAVLVDMESYWLAKACQARGVPFLAVRAVSDPLEANLAGLNSVLQEDGQSPDPKALLRGLLRRPALLPALLRLGLDTRRASRSLAAVLHAFLPALARQEIASSPC